MKLMKDGTVFLELIAKIGTKLKSSKLNIKKLYEHFKSIDKTNKEESINAINNLCDLYRKDTSSDLISIDELKYLTSKDKCISSKNYIIVEMVGALAK